MKRKVNETLLQLMLGILLWGIFWQAAGVWFVSDKSGCSLGLWLGILTAEACAVHMYWSLDRALDRPEKDAQKYMMAWNLARYGMVAVIFFLIMISGIANPLCGFLGLIGLKAAAYMQPAVRKLLGKLRKNK